MEPELQQGPPLASPFRDLYALALVEGRVDDARQRLGAWADQPPVPRDHLWVGFTVLRARAFTWLGMQMGALWCRLADAAAVATLRDELTPYASRVGPAREHVLHAREVHQRLGLTGWVERTDRLLGAVGAP
jgi:hypothetical protein